MASELETLLADVLELIPNEEFCLRHWENGTWQAELVNKWSSVALGEAWPVYKGTGATPEEALRKALVEMRHNSGTGYRG